MASLLQWFGALSPLKKAVAAAVLFGGVVLVVWLASKAGGGSGPSTSACCEDSGKRCAFDAMCSSGKCGGAASCTGDPMALDANPTPAFNSKWKATSASKGPISTMEVTDDSNFAVKGQCQQGVDCDWGSVAAYVPMSDNVVFVQWENGVAAQMELTESASSGKQIAVTYVAVAGEAQGSGVVPQTLTTAS